jgi:hypothetical protein
MTLTTTTTRANVILSEFLREVPLKALTPKVVMWNLLNQDNIDGVPSLTKEIPVESDLGAAIAGSEGVAFTTVTPLAYDSSISVTPTEAAMARADITTRAMRRALPGMTAGQVYDRIATGDLSGLGTLLQDEAARLMQMGWEKVETDCQALLDDASSSVGTSTQDLTLANLLAALAIMEGRDLAHEDMAWILAPQQIVDLRTELSSGSGAALNTIQINQADASFFNVNPDMSRNGFKGSLLRLPIYSPSQSLNPRPNAGADVAGALACIGRGVTGQPGSQRGFAEFTEGHGPRFLFSFDTAARVVYLVLVWEYAVVEHTDLHYVSIVTDAPT